MYTYPIDRLGRRVYGRAMKQPQRVQLGTSTFRSVRDRLNEHCHQHGVRVWAFVTEAICEKLDRCRPVEHG